MLTMTLVARTLTTKPLSSASAGALRLAAAGAAAVTRFVRGLAHRREILFLSEVDDRALKDIGLVRSDLDGALATSWLTDPSQVLADRSQASSGVAASRREIAERRASAAPAETSRPVADGAQIACGA